MTKEDILGLLEMSVEVLSTPSIKSGDLYDVIFNPDLPGSIVNFSNKALHPSTTRNKINRTEVQNINFVFSTPEAVNAQWEYLYSRLPLLLLYLNEVLDFAIFDHLKLANSILVDRLTERDEFIKRNK